MKVVVEIVEPSKFPLLLKHNMLIKVLRGQLETHNRIIIAPFNKLTKTRFNLMVRKAQVEEKTVMLMIVRALK
jgi:hypothetical protein